MLQPPSPRPPLPAVNCANHGLIHWLVVNLEALEAVCFPSFPCHVCAMPINIVGAVPCCLEKAEALTMSFVCGCPCW